MKGRRQRRELDTGEPKLAPETEAVQKGIREHKRRIGRHLLEPPGIRGTSSASKRGFGRWIGGNGAREMHTLSGFPVARGGVL